MTRHLLVAGATALVLVDLPLRTAAQVIIRNMDSAAIQRAIAFGTTADKLEPHEIRASGPPLAMNREKVKMGGYTTPFLRVALAAFQAKRLYQPFDAEQVTPAMTRPVLEVYAVSVPRYGVTGAVASPNIGNVQTIVITKVGQREPVIRPIETTPLPVLWRNLMGFSAETKRLVRDLSAGGAHQRA